MINIRPSKGNSGMEVESGAIREAMKAMVFELVGRGEELP
jgi:hypothetical protein